MIVVFPDHTHYFRRGYYEKQICEIILNFVQWFRRCFLKDFLSGALAALLFGGAKPYVIFKDDIMWNINVKLHEIWTSGLGRVVVF